ncbi:MAG TPA: hypothetical protein PKE26_11040 [Kiritimatiellia bacterium]|nr:hypothetical protein [Kiritimatiellia bacterium]HMO99634.1 hypothetical protein [Kiritimatiellia bacterium]HMP97119.1 hypothetical protein [Kiritimatiellia bacterium]
MTPALIAGPYRPLRPHWFLIAIIAAAILVACVTKKPGGRSDFWTTGSYAEDNVIYHGIGVRF